VEMKDERDSNAQGHIPRNWIPSVVIPVIPVVVHPMLPVIAVYREKAY
jgi:hypothetical protein